ncbi:MAG TPA: twin-arginine translocase TatA/TatE family subunit [Sulfurospirillum arcachonense]|nr:twin-arginine translocase TatA/TatE family subunit [Sulfurospirillum arcachonense]HIP44999.1 twin-arginine translocase TatA/TatE family subunit [Sulfurospirillum arcachonense]
MGVPSMPELLIILAIVVLLFGAKKIPDLAKGIGKGIKSFRSEMKEDEVVADKPADEKIEKSEETVSAKKVEETKEA